MFDIVLNDFDIFWILSYSQVKDDFLRVKYLYAKSDNASSYHGNHYVEALYKLCEERKVYLKRYDYNEPSRGKDQCDRESAGAKCVIRSFIDAGNNVVTAEDIYDALHYGKGIQNADVAVVSIDSKVSNLLGSTTIPSIRNYHSFQFFSDHMVMWRYFGIGEGKKWKFTNVTFRSSVQIVKPYSSTCKTQRCQSLKSHVLIEVSTISNFVHKMAALNHSVTKTP